MKMKKKTEPKRTSAVIDATAFDLCFEAVVAAGRQARKYQDRIEDAYTDDEKAFAEQSHKDALDRCQLALEQMFQLDRKARASNQ